MDPQTLRSVRSKLESSRIRTDSLIHKCEKVDKNGDDLIHADDLEDVLYEVLGPKTLNRREINALTNSLEVPGTSRRSVEYKRLADLIDGRTSSDINNVRNSSENYNFRQSQTDNWREDTMDNTNANTTSNRSRNRQGSIGEWLQTASCPAERKNFRKFIDAMERFERETGMKINNQPDGFTVPLGPDLRCQIKFFMG